VFVLPHPPWAPPDPCAYSYLLGVYLGDGCVSRPWGKVQLQIYLDAGYPNIVDEVEAAMAKVIPGRRVHRYARPGTRSLALQASSPRWLLAFPQHGPGRKHERTIKLADWQEEITQQHPRELIRGLIHSDGCRSINRFSVELPIGGRTRYEYVRYFFSNLSADIRGIFTEHCDLLGVRWTRSNPRNISISHGPSVALLESFVGPKT
jgi:hypothetical protein